MAFKYESINPELLKKMILNAHNEKKAKIRAEFLRAEFAFFKEYINNKRVLVAGSGLGHDAFELAQYNREIRGVELLQPLVDYSIEEARKRNVTNVCFEQGDITNLRFKDNEFDVSVLNMGTICNFNNKEIIVSELLRVSSVFYFDFYPPSEKNLKKRKMLYAEEGYSNMRIEGTALVSSEGLYSASLTKQEVNELIKSLGFEVQYYDFCDFATMAVVFKL